jgi:hypothetical protein
MITHSVKSCYGLIISGKDTVLSAILPRLVFGLIKPSVLDVPTNLSLWAQQIEYNNYHLPPSAVIVCNIRNTIFLYLTYLSIKIHLWSSGQSSWLQVQRSLIRFPALPDFLRSSGSGKGSTQPDYATRSIHKNWH